MNEERGGQSAGEQRGARGAESRGGRTRVAEISPKQKTVIRQKFSGGGHHRISRSDVNFNIAVGTAIPGSVAVYPLPADLIEVVPWFRGYDYILVGDTLLIVDPGSRAIVAVVAV
jgi:hypothetical protein